jgi:hypothetical protein
VSFSLLLLVSVALFCGMLLFVGTYRPSLIWPSLIVSLIFGSGLMPFGLTVVDEVMVGSLMLGILFVWARNKNKEISSTAPPVRDVLYEIHRWVFIVFTVYLVFQCARGMIVMESFRKFRWIFFFVVLGGFSAILDRTKGTPPDRSQVALWVVKSTIVSLAFYLIHGVTAQFLRGTSWLDLQCKEMGTTAYSLFVVVLGAPASLIVIREGLRNRWWGEICLVIMFMTSLYYDSRVAVIVLMGFLMLGFFYVPWRSFLRVGAIWTLSVVLFGFGFLGKKIDLLTLSNDIFGSAGLDKVLPVDRVVRHLRYGSVNTALKNHANHFLEPETSPMDKTPTLAVSIPALVPAPSKASTPAEEVKTAPPPTSKQVVVTNKLVNDSPTENKIANKTPEAPAEKPRYFLLDPNSRGRVHDIDRIVHAEVALRLMSQGGGALWFGHGYRMSGRVVSPILRELYAVFIPARAGTVRDDESTEAFTAWVADTGIVGLLLLMALFVLTAIRSLKNSRGTMRVIMVCCTMMTFLWMFVINLSDIYLFFFSVLPSGIIVALSRSQGSNPSS